MHVLRILYTPYVTYFWAALRNADLWMANCVVFPPRITSTVCIPEETSTSHLLRVTGGTRWDHFFRAPKQTLTGRSVKDSLQPYTHAYKTLRSHHFRVLRGTR